MKCLLLYYTGTFNTRYMTNKVKDRLVKEGYEVDTYEIDPLKTERLEFSSYDLLGLGYPIYGFNAPYPFLKFIKKQKFNKPLKAFIYKDSGETYHANDASSVSVYRNLKRKGVKITNEYHFLMPYNIHFRFEDNLVKEMLDVNELLLDILEKEISEDIPNIKKYKFIHRFVTQVVKLQFIGGDVNSFFYKVDKKKCIKCNKCVNNCPMKNIYAKDGKVKFHHHCLMCMRCSLFCPTDAISIGILNGWRVNGPYDFKKIEAINNEAPIITDETKGFFKCYIESYQTIKKRHVELFGN